MGKAFLYGKSGGGSKPLSLYNTEDITATAMNDIRVGDTVCVKGGFDYVEGFEFYDYVRDDYRLNNIFSFSMPNTYSCEIAIVGRLS